MIERVIFLVVGGFNERDYERHGLPILLENGFPVEVWDFTSILHPSLQDAAQREMPRAAWFVPLESRCQVGERVASLGAGDFVVNLLTYGPWSLLVYRALMKSGAQYGVVSANTLPIPAGLASWSYRMRRLMDLKRFGALKVKERLLAALPPRYVGVKPARLVFAGGEKTVNGAYPTGEATEIVNIHAYDYDIYLKEGKIPADQKQTALFLDDQLAIADEFTMYGEKPNMEADRYFSLLNRFFNLVEGRTGLKVTIACHPRSHYEELPDYFEGRPRVKGRTARLVKESSLVLAHYSTSINFANLFNKPILFMTCSDIRGTTDDYWIEEMARQHGKKPALMDKAGEVDFEREMVVSAQDYERYRRWYIKSPDSEDIPFWQIVAKRLKKGI